MYVAAYRRSVFLGKAPSAWESRGGAGGHQLHTAPFSWVEDKQGTELIGGMTGILPSIGRVSDGEGSSDRYRRRLGKDGV